ncbi:hypothetical protein [Sulfuriroseicoccus oceanibius]|uniref:Quinol:cytochrome C oxidoreductase n=1 Tax=Sulfuriroseicoccus oceanibius TaxID=2707525 RepID=A0A6B3L6C0_9BACT|nr:hypothetical protein [Sulfuriroseicoccus oceanibius]QQL44636.1 hypothetical protein G3M56_012205 [Sulfuriroseicoccus oceanibius]
MAGHINLKELPLNGERFDFSKVSRLATGLLAVGGIGLVASLFFLFNEGTQKAFSFSWLLGTFFFFTIAVGGVFWTLLHHATNSGWGIAVRRVFEKVGLVIPVVGILMIPLFTITPVKHTLWHWTEIEDRLGAKAEQPEVIAEFEAKHNAHVAEFAAIKASAEAAGNTAEAELAQKEIENLGDFDASKIKGKLIKKEDPILYGKKGYLNQTFWYIRYVAFFVLLTYVIRQMRKWSVRQDSEGGVKLTFRMRRAACGFMIIFALAMTFVALDMVMAIDHHWFSTMWGVYVFAGSALSGMATIILATTYIRSKGYMKGVVSSEHYHVMGKLMFAFVVFWAYITFSQFFLIWYANITEETKYFLIRNTEFWNYFSIALVVLHFIVPFVILLQSWLKRKPAWLSSMAVYILLVHLLDVYLMIIPMRGPLVAHNYFYQGGVLYDLLAVVTVGCLVVGAFLFSLRKDSLFPCRDPRLLESINLHN